jgi:hypothetical protein
MIRVTVLAALVAAGLAVPVQAATGPEPLPVARPDVAPAPTGIKGRPFVGLLKVPQGFVQEEYLVSGTAAPAVGPAVAGGLTPLGPKLAGTDRLPPLPYVTRVVVVRPKTERRSNGAGVVVWQNVTFGHDIGEWFTIGNEVVDNGWTYVEASVQLASVPALKAFDPVRYGTVAIPSDAYSYDIYSQVAKALRQGLLTSGRRLRTVLAMGASQSGTALNQYLAEVQPRYERVYDGFVVAVANGPDPRIDRPVIRLLSENEIDGSSASPDGPRYRQWEVAGSSHGSKTDFTYIGAQEQRDLGGDLVNFLAGDNGPFGTSDCLINRFSDGQGYSGATAALLRWVRTGAAPPVQPRMRVVDGVIQRDADGNGIGGIRYPDIAVPRAAFNRTGDCVQLDGRTEPFSPARLAQLYPKRGDYQRKLRAAIRTAVRAGVLTPGDAARIR